MKSSIPVFTRRNPFQSSSKAGKTHYYPSSNQCLTKKKKKTALSPVRLNRQSTSDALSPKDKQSSEKRDNGAATTDGQPDYAELWPCTDLGSSPASSITSSDREIHKQTATAQKSTVSFELEEKEGSVLAKYIERFRCGRPQSREERQVMALTEGEEQLHLWWMSPSCSTPTKTTDEDSILFRKDDHESAIFSPAEQHQSTRHLSPCRRSLSVSSCDEFDGLDILQLQERASTLLLRGEPVLGDESVPVSSEGLGCSDFSSPATVDEPVRRPLIPSLMKSTVNANSASIPAAATTKFPFNSMVTSTRPEDDILFQWRLRRKMEQAREQPQSVRQHSHHGPTFSWQAPNLSHYSNSGQEYKKQQSTQPLEVPQKATHAHILSPQPEIKDAREPFPPVSNPTLFQNSGSSVSQSQTGVHVPAHMHLLCDILPCPVRSSPAHRQQSISRSSGELKVVHKKTQALRNLTEEPTLEPGSSSPNVPARAEHGEWPSHHKIQDKDRTDNGQTEKNKDTKATSTRRLKKSRCPVGSELSNGHSSTYSSSHQRPKKVKPRTEPQGQQGAQDLPGVRSTGDPAAPPSLIHSTLGQVVSEVLFPTEESTPAQKTRVSMAAPSAALAPPQSPVPLHSTQNSVEVISQLLQEAEDSDEKEFEDDPLLQVLRKQRKWVKKQISEVDLMLNELEEQQAT